MIKARPIWILFLLCWFSVACDKTEPELLSGDIAGFVRVYDENYYLEEDMSGLQVAIRDETFQDQSSTDASGKFLFEDIFYGNYLVDVEMEGYFSIYTDFPLHHLGGYSPTLVEYQIHEIPKFETHIDSIRFEETYNRYYISVNLTGMSGPPLFGYDFVCFFSDSPEVSLDHFVSDDVGWIWVDYMDGSRGEIMVEIWDNRFDPLKSDSIYCCVYPRAFGTSQYVIIPESLGLASNVFSFMAE